MILAVSKLHAQAPHQESLEAAFRARKKLVDKHAGFRRLQLVKARGGDEYMLLLLWDDMESFRSYVKSADFQHAHPPGGDEDAVTPGGLRVYDLVLDSDRGE